MNFCEICEKSKLQILEELATLLSGKKATRVLLYPMTKEYEVLLSLIIIQVASSCQNLLRNFFFEHDFQSVFHDQHHHNRHSFPPPTNE